MAGELPAFDLKEFNKWKEQTMIVMQSDMTAEEENEVKFFISSGIEKWSGATGVDVIQACKSIKEALDRQLGPCFHCVMGEGFSFEVTAQAKSSLYVFFGGKLGVLVFKC